MAPALGSVGADDVLTPEQAAQVTALHQRLDELADVPLPGKGSTPDRWRFLAAAGRRDLAHARLVEGHLDALAILHELGRPDVIEPGEAWGVWAAQPERLVAEHSGQGWRLTGTKGWCSGSRGLDVALVTATADDGPRLFVIDPADVQIEDGSWDPIGMAATASHTITVDMRVPDDAAIAGPGAYVDRPGFWHGGAGVAACWYGGAEALLAPLAERIQTGAADAPTTATSTALALAFARARSRLDAAAALLHRAAEAIDQHPTDLAPARRDALGVRLAVEDAARLTLDVVGVALGAGALCGATPHSRRVADLTVYLRQLDVGAVSVEFARLAAAQPIVAP